MSNFSTHVLSAEPDDVSPGGGAEIRHILRSPQGDLTHAVCPIGDVAPNHHLPEADEQFYVLAGEGEIWRTGEGRDAITGLRPGRWVAMPRGTQFQYRANFGKPLIFLVCVLPSWTPDLFHTLPTGRWPAGTDDNTPPTPWTDLVDGWRSGDLPQSYDAIAPDGSEIRLLGAFADGSLSHCTLRTGARSTAVRHRTVHEIWYVVDGFGEIWRRGTDGQEEVTRLAAGTGVDIPVGTSFQFRATGVDPLRIVILTMPRWPGDDEAMRTEGIWAPTVIG